MQVYHSQVLIDRLPASELKFHLLARYNQLSEGTDIPPNIVLVEADDEIAGRDYSFIGNRGLLSDFFEEHEPGHPEFARPFEWASYLPELKIYEVLLLIHGEDGVFIYLPDSIVEANPKLHWVLTDASQGGLSNPQLIY
jgi:hypothetical protein